MIKYVEILVHHMVWYSYLEEGELKKQLYAINVFISLAWGWWQFFYTNYFLRVLEIMFLRHLSDFIL